jgi:MFS family permease
MPPPPPEHPLWRNRAFTRLFWAHSISLLGASLSSVAIGLLAHELVGTSVSQVVGIALTIRIAVVVFLSPFAGMVADKFGTKATLLGADFIRAGIVVGFFFTQAVWQIYVLAFLLNLASALFTPVYKAAIPNLVTAAQYPRALSFGAVAYDFANITGPPLAGLLILSFGFRGNFLLHAAAFLVSAALIAPLRFKGAGTPVAAKPRRLHGVSAMFRRRELLQALFLAVQISIAGGFVLVATVDHVKNNLGLPDSYYAWAMAAYGIGSVAGALSYGQCAREGVKVFLIATVPWGMLAGLFLAAWGHGFGLLLVAWVMTGAGQSVLGIRSNELLAANSVPQERSHIYAAHFSLSHAGWGLTYPLAGWSTTTLGFHHAAFLFSLLLLTAITFQGIYLRLRQGPREGSPAE